MTDYLDRLADAAAGIRHDALPAATLAAARLVLLDTLGAIVAGSALPENGRLAELAAERSREGRATLLGHRMRADAFWAALANATAGVALEMDEGNRLGGGHPAIHVIPGALAVAEERGIGGRRLLEAIVAGYEIGSRLGGATTPRPNVHSHGTWGTISTAVAVARLGGLDATSDAPGHQPRRLDEPGQYVDARPRGRHHPQPLSRPLRVSGHPRRRPGPRRLHRAPRRPVGRVRDDPRRSLRAGARRRRPRRSGYRIEENYFKFYACCRYNHFALDAIAAMRRAHPFSAEEVAAVHVTTIPFGLRMADADPASMLAAKFSVPHAVAATLVLGHAGLDAFEAAALADPRIRDLARRVEVTADPEMGPRRTDYPTACVRIALRDGRALEETVTIVRGDALNPAPAEEVVAKFLALASPVLGSSRARRAVDAVNDVGALDNVRDLAGLCAGE